MDTSAHTSTYMHPCIHSETSANAHRQHSFTRAPAGTSPSQSASSSETPTLSHLVERGSSIRLTSLFLPPPPPPLHSTVVAVCPRPQSSAMATYDITPRLIPFLDRHMVLAAAGVSAGQEAVLRSVSTAGQGGVRGPHEDGGPVQGRVCGAATTARSQRGCSSATRRCTAR